MAQGEHARKSILPLTTLTITNLQLDKLFLTFRFHEIKKDHESFTANIGVRVRGRTVRPKVCGTLRVVRGKFFEN